MRGSGLEVIRCAENHEEVIGLLHVAKVLLFVARQSFIEQLSNSVVFQITNFGKGTHILAVLESDSIEDASAGKMLRLGCRGVLPRRFSSKLFERAVLALIRGEIWAPPRVVSELLSDLLKAATFQMQYDLTPQETRILELSSQGYKNSSIAEVLFISLETVRWHKRRLNKKLRRASHPRRPHKPPSPAHEMAG
jgi:DNA-binding NarL/FixJ family response regulator